MGEEAREQGATSPARRRRARGRWPRLNAFLESDDRGGVAALRRGWGETAFPARVRTPTQCAEGDRRGRHRGPTRRAPRPPAWWHPPTTRPGACWRPLAALQATAAESPAAAVHVAVPPVRASPRQGGRCARGAHHQRPANRRGTPTPPHLGSSLCRRPRPHCDRRRPPPTRTTRGGKRARRGEGAPRTGDIQRRHGRGGRSRVVRFKRE